MNTTKKIAASKDFPLVWAEVDLDALRNNLRIIRSKLSGSKVKILAIVKADAYGHGMKKTAEALKKEGVNFFGVANIDEAIELRKICPKAEILVLGSFHGSQVPFYASYRIIPTVSSIEDLNVLESRLPVSAKKFPIHAKVDTGMGRLGVWHEEAEKLFLEAKRKKKVFVDGVYTHFANADHEKKERTHRQILIFEKILQKIKALGFHPRYVHAANSMGLLRFKHAHLNLVRPGIILYGISPSKNLPLPKRLKPILTLKTRICFLREASKGRSISYGSTYKTPSKTLIATLPIGYSHGYRVGFSNKAFVLVKGKKCPVVGRVTMDQILVNVGRVPGVKRWDEVILIGEDKGQEVKAQDLADLIETIPYEISCSIHSRIPRIYKAL